MDEWGEWCMGGRGVWMSGGGVVHGWEGCMDEWEGSGVWVGGVCRWGCMDAWVMMGGE